MSGNGILKNPALFLPNQYETQKLDYISDFIVLNQMFPVFYFHFKDGIDLYSTLSKAFNRNVQRNSKQKG